MIGAGPTAATLGMDSDKFIKRVSQARRRKIWQRYHRLLNKNEPTLRKATREFFKFAIAEVKEAGRTARAKSTPTKTVKALLDWDDFEAAATRIFKPAMLEVLGEGGKATVEQGMFKRDYFDMINESATAWSAGHAAKLVTSITKELMGTIRGIVVSGVESGAALWPYIRALEPIIPLLPKHAQAVVNMGAQMTADGFTASEVKAAMDARARRLLRYRAAMIARTETAFSLIEGQRQGFKQIGIKKVIWIADMSEDCCEYCQDQNGSVHNIDEIEGLQPAHPHCECTWAAYYGDDGPDLTPNQKMTDRIWKDAQKSGGKIEYAGAMDAQGKTLIYKKGASDHVNFTDAESKKIKGASVFSHNHPNGTAFSGPDYMFGSVQDVKTMQVITEKGVWQAIRPAGGWPAWQTIGADYKAIDGIAFNKFKPKYDRLVLAGMPRQEAAVLVQREHTQFINEELAKMHNFKLEFIDRDDFGGY